MVFSDLMKRFLTATTVVIVGGAWLWVSSIVPIIFIVGLCLLQGISQYEWFCISRHQSTSFKIIGHFIIFLGFGSWGSLHLVFGVYFTIWVLSLAIISDTAAYFGGRLIQGPKLCPVISPSKTWAGALTSLAIAPFFPILFNVTLSKSMNVQWEWLPAVVLVAIGQIGDLIESAAKRKCSVKDSGIWLPGHGGFLDRLDSALAMFIAFDVFILIIGCFSC